MLDLDHPTEASDARALAKCAWTPFDGFRSRSRIVTTLVNGVVAWRDEQVTAAAPGHRLVCNTAR